MTPAIQPQHSVEEEISHAHAGCSCNPCTCDPCTCGSTVAPIKEEVKVEVSHAGCSCNPCTCDPCTCG